MNMLMKLMKEEARALSSPTEFKECTIAQYKIATSQLKNWD